MLLIFWKIFHVFLTAWIESGTFASASPRGSDLYRYSERDFSSRRKKWPLSGFFLHAQCVPLCTRGKVNFHIVRRADKMLAGFVDI